MQQTHLGLELGPDVAWHGRAEDLPNLLGSVLAHCDCRPADQHVCTAHQLLGDQHALDHLAFARSVRQRLLGEEAGPAGPRGDRAEWSALLARCRASALPRTAPPRPGLGFARAVVLSLLALALVLGGLSGPRHRASTTAARPIATSSSR